MKVADQRPTAVVEDLARRILDGRLDEGRILRPRELTAELHIGRSELHEAIKVLIAKGLLGNRPQRGTYVRPRNDWNLLDTDVPRWQLAADGPDPAPLRLA
jgi:DNA-binding FadR family transcriptional regulator